MYQVIPKPRSITSLGGTTLLRGDMRITYAQEGLGKLGQLLQGEMQALTGLELRCEEYSAAGHGQAILLEVDSSLAPGEYKLEIAGDITVKGGSYQGVSYGTVTLLQLMARELAGFKVPHCVVEDRPYASYRGLMIDLARKWHSVEAIKEIIILCRWYKIPYLQLHLTDDESFVFPSQAFPELATPARSYTLEELHELERFAEARGVTIVPEVDVPGHARSMIAARPDLFATNPPQGNVICPGREGVYQALDTLIGEVCSVFRATPFFHIGADEVEKAFWEACSDCQEYMAQKAISNVDELYRHFIVRMRDIVHKYGKKMFVWEGFAKEGEIEIPKDITPRGGVMRLARIPLRFVETLHPSKRGYTAFHRGVHRK
ncbi:MAG: family 20 glycosylhydrolase [Limnochordia bacterium]|jgi:hexosaminidase